MHTPYGVVVVVAEVAASKLHIRPEQTLKRNLMLEKVTIRFFSGNKYITEFFNLLKKNAI